MHTCTPLKIPVGNKSGVTQPQTTCTKCYALIMQILHNFGMTPQGGREGGGRGEGEVGGLICSSMNLADLENTDVTELIVTMNVKVPLPHLPLSLSLSLSVDLTVMQADNTLCQRKRLVSLSGWRECHLFAGGFASKPIISDQSYFFHSINANFFF